MQHFNEKVEIAPIACLIKNPSLLAVVEDILTRKTFGWGAFGDIYHTIKTLNSRDVIPDKFTLTTELELLEILDTITIPSNGLRGRKALEYIENFPDVDENYIEAYAYQAQKVQASRDLVSALTSAVSKIEENADPLAVLAQLDIDSGKVAMMLGSRSNSLKEAKSVAVQVLDDYTATANGELPYIKTGIKAWDDFTNGLAKGRLYIVSAVSNDGKSSLVQNILYNISVKSPVDGRPLQKGCLISMEASAQDVFRKLIQRITGISTLRIESGDLSEQEESSMAEAVALIGRSPVIFDDSSELILALVRTKIRQAVEQGAKYIIIDQLEQILLGGGGDTQAEHIKINFISYRLKAFARESDVPIILVHQMNRGIDSGDNRGKDKDPQIQDLAQAGEKAADAILMLRHKKQKQTILQSAFWWVKNRQGKKGFREVKFNGERILFEDLPEQPENVPEFLQPELEEREKYDNAQAGIPNTSSR
jgi:replicative DNA helicase